MKIKVFVYFVNYLKQKIKMSVPFLPYLCIASLSLLWNESQ